MVAPILFSPRGRIISYKSEDLYEKSVKNFFRPVIKEYCDILFFLTDRKKFFQNSGSCFLNRHP
jgi:hypothetical protein